MPVADRRLPGIAFEAEPPVPEGILPRMDVAAFAGFAARGPMHVPVPIEDAAQFEEVFGPELELGWDPQRGEPARAHLDSAVRGFLRNGGTRCWVVRVGDGGASADRFELPGLVAIDSRSVDSHAIAAASSEGAWADHMRVATSIVTAPLRVRALQLRDDGSSLEVEGAQPGDVEAGDLLSLNAPGDPWTLLVPVAAVEPSGAGLDVQGHAVWWVREELPAAGPCAATWFTGRDEPVTVPAEVAPAAGGRARMTVPSAPDLRLPSEGALVRVDLGGVSTWLLVERVELADEEQSPPDPVVAVLGRPFELTRRPGQPPPATSRAARLSLELRSVVADRAERSGLLGFGAEHPRAPHRVLDSDESRWRRPLEPDAPLGTRAEPGFALAVPDPVPLLLPLAVGFAPTAWLGALVPPGTRPERDGRGRALQDAFLDRDLVHTGTRPLIAEADFITQGSARPRPLDGVHALLAIEEVTVVAVPDAVHGELRPRHLLPAPAPEPPVEIESEVPAGFVDCDRVELAAPVLDRHEEVGGLLRLEWGEVPGEGVEYELQEAVDGAWETAITVLEGPERAYEARDRSAGVTLYYRVRARLGDRVSPWSNGQEGHVDPPHAFAVAPDEDYRDDALLAVQGALMRMCAARGDMLAILALPRHYRQEEAVTHLAALRGARGVGAGEALALRYGAAWHPWLLAGVEARPGAVRSLPPDGPVAGILARFAAEEGAWAPPANEALRDVLALAPRIPAAARQGLQDARLNLVRQEPAGFLWLAADTLSREPDLRPIGVRRLLQLLVRLARRDGALYAFEPNTAALRRSIRRGLEALLGRLFELGAFAGDGPEVAFQIVAGSPPNAPASVDAGRLIVELKVAPSRPLAFITVRLVRGGEGLLRVEAG